MMKSISLRNQILSLGLLVLSFSAASQEIKICKDMFTGPSAIALYNPEVVEGWYASAVTKAKTLVPGQPLLSIVIPAYKEQNRLPRTLKKVQEFFNNYPLPVEIIASIEKSPDQTWLKASEAVAGDSRFQVVDNRIQRGKGYAVRKGMLSARGTYVLFMDADLATPMPEALHFIDTLVRSPETSVVIGNRRASYDLDSGVLRSVLSQGFAYLRQRLIGLADITDTQCGFKAFTQESAREIFTRQTTDGFSFDIEVLLLADGLNKKITEVPVHWENDLNESKVNPITEPVKMLMDMARMKKIVNATLSRQP
jgi:dolichyl-phosphate beta-glucosyltransferase